MLKLSTRLFAAGTLAALLISVTQDGFAHEKTAKSAAKKAAMPCCVEKNGVMSCPEDAAASKTAARKMGAKTTSNAKMTPKAAGRAMAVKTSAVKTSSKAKSESHCPHSDTNAQPA